MKTISQVTYLLLLLSLLGCQSTTQSFQQQVPLFINEPSSFKMLSVESTNEIFAHNNEIKKHLDDAFPHSQRSLHTTRRLLNFLLDNGDASLSYQSGATLTANQTYRDLNANCLSLSILAFAMAEHLGLEGQFQRVYIPEYWALNKGYNLLTGHINLVVKKASKANGQLVYDVSNSLVIDFDSNSRGEKFKTSPITKARIAAMFYNNKGAAAMLNKRYELAYSYFKAAIDIDNNYSGSWGNLGILMRMHNRFANAEAAYNYAITLNPHNNTALGNLALLYKLTNRESKAQIILTKLDKNRQSNPYYHISLGNSAYVAKQYQDAIRYYNKAKRLDKSLHDSYFGLAQTYYQLGDFKRTQRLLKLANKKADFDHDKNRYKSKLDMLNTLSAKLNSY